MKKGFTLIELLVVIGIFGALMLAGTVFLISVMRNANQTRIENEVRQTASRILLDIASEMRKATTATFASNTLTIGSGITYTLDSNHDLKKNGILMNTSIARVTVFTVSTPIDSSHPAIITLTVSADPAYLMPGFNPVVTLNDTLVPRQY